MVNLRHKYMGQVCRGAAEFQVKAGRKLVGRYTCQDLNRPFLRALGFSSLSSSASHTRSAKALIPIVINPTGFPLLNREGK